MPAADASHTSTLRPPCRALAPRRRPKPRIIVVQPRYRKNDRGERMLTVATFFDGNEVLPMIRIRGRWLAELGFTRDARIAVSEERGRLVLTIVREE
jgi:hypothetical protein